MGGNLLAQPLFEIMERHEGSTGPNAMARLDSGLWLRDDAALHLGDDPNEQSSIIRPSSSSALKFTPAQGDEEALSEDDVDLLAEVLSENGQDANLQVNPSESTPEHPGSGLTRSFTGNSRFSFSIPAFEDDDEGVQEGSRNEDDDEENLENQEEDNDQDQEEAQQPQEEAGFSSKIPPSSSPSLNALSVTHSDATEPSEDSQTDPASFQDESELIAQRSRALEAEKREMRKRRALEQAQTQNNAQDPPLSKHLKTEESELELRPASPMFSAGAFDSASFDLGRLDTF